MMNGNIIISEKIMLSSKIRISERIDHEDFTLIWRSEIKKEKDLYHGFTCNMEYTSKYTGY